MTEMFFGFIAVVFAFSWFCKKIINKFNEEEKITTLNDDEKRWCVYGIVLCHVFIPAVRPYLEKKILNEYDKLKESHNIHVQRSPLTMFSHLHYKNINNNEKKDKKNFDYKITSHVDFGKLFLQDHMAKFNSYDCCDASAVLNLFVRINIFSNLVQNAAKIVKNDRNSWAHCSFLEFGGTDFHQKIDNMKQLVKDLCLGTKVLNDMNYWKNQALTLWTNDRASHEKLKEHINNLSNEIEEIKFENEDCQRLLLETLNRFSHFMKEISQIKRTVNDTNEKVDEIKDKLKETNDTVDELEEKLKETNDGIQQILKILQQPTKPQTSIATNQPQVEQNDIQYKSKGIQVQFEKLQGSTAINQPHPSTKHESQLQEWKYLGESTKHRNLLLKLCDHKDEIKLLGDVRVIFSDEFCIGKGSNGTRVFLGLRKDGYGKAVKRIHRHNWIRFAQQEKKILNELNAKRSKYIAKFSSFEEDTGMDYVYLILDLCEESLESFVKSSTLNDLQKILPKILRQILQGLADLHSGPRPILHRDLKPSNILRDSNSNFMLADFGISRKLEFNTTTFTSLANVGTPYWIPPESYDKDDDSFDKARYKKESDVYNAGMVAYYVASGGRHPFGTQRFRLDNMMKGNPVGLMEIKDEALKDLLSWMLNLLPEDRPLANEALKHPFLMSDEEKFDLLCKVGNQQRIKRNDPKSIAVQQLNSEFSDWKSQMDCDVYNYFRTNVRNGRIHHYGFSWTECLRLIRNVGQNWNDETQPRPQPEPFYKIGDPKNYFLKTFPNLPVRVHAAVRSDDELKNNPELKNVFNFNLSKM